ncbi:hypothetical protein DM01DRAFT_1119402 [Hesseltinella vesiculosa]|uniref:ARM repeat-containing protein n=1 Tax=Hesseltinella vesiculosa TaxID=101127 RepID=A0A1X2GUT6_9FUNG|nr:hypothetical protein DM01DRAFT_1119402 [Hesseltinella vesiculosa]
MYFIESYASAFAAMCNQSSLDTNKMTTCISWWQSNLEKHIQQSSLDPSPKVKVATCDCLAAISSSIFEQLPMRYQRLSIALLMPLTEDPDAAVRAAACRAIGVFILFPTLREDECFVSDVTTVVLNGMSDPSLLVRLRVSWAQGNLSDSLIITSQTTEDFNLPEWITFKDWNRMLEIASHAAMDNDKLRPNAVRSLGGILRIAPLSYFERRESLDVVQSVILAIVKNMETGSLKARWNACHAASNTLKNAAIPIGYVKKNTNVKQYPWTPIFYQTLLHCMTKCANYKVRINACLALASPTDVAQFGDQWEPVYKALIAAWDDIQTLEAGTDFNERKYRSQLKDQLQATLNHIHAWLPPELQAKLNFDK